MYYKGKLIVTFRGLSECIYIYILKLINLNFCFKVQPQAWSPVDHPTCLSNNSTKPNLLTLPSTSTYHDNRNSATSVQLDPQTAEAGERKTL